MQYGIITDVHSNLEALFAVKKDIKEYYPQIGRRVNLGDKVGYMPNPNEVMDELEGFIDLDIIGNHDLAVGGEMDLEWFNSRARAAVIWTMNNLNSKNKKRLEGLINSKSYSRREGNLLFAHGTPNNPERMEYVFETSDANLHFFCIPEFDGVFSFVGHSHCSQLYTTTEHSPKYKDVKSQVTLNRNYVGRTVKSYPLSEFRRALVVVPSVGQPRDKCNFAGYVVYDSKTKEIDFVRVAYDYETTQNKMRELGFDPGLISRLKFGK